MSKYQPQQFARCTRKLITVRFGDLKADPAAGYCHRNVRALSNQSITELAESLIQEGQQVPLVVIRRGDRFLVIGGHRRAAAFRYAIEQNLDISRFNENTLVFAVEIIRGEQQDEDAFEQDLYLASVTDNEIRAPLTDIERLGVVQGMIDRRIPNNRGMRAAGVKDTQYRRLVRICQHEWMYDYVKREGREEIITSTDAAALLEQVDEHPNREGELRDHMATVVASLKAEIETERRRYKEVKKEYSKTVRSIASERKLYKIWHDCLENEIPLRDEEDFQFNVMVDGDRVTVPPLNFDASKMELESIERIITGLDRGRTALLPYMIRARAIRDVAQLSEAQAEDEIRLLREKERRNEEARTEAEKGRQPLDPMPSPVPPTTTDLTYEIELSSEEE